MQCANTLYFITTHSDTHISASNAFIPSTRMVAFN